MGEVEIDSPRERDGSFDPQLIPKRSKDVSGIADKIEDIYGFGISNITDRIIETAGEWQNRPLKKFYPFSSLTACM